MNVILYFILSWGGGWLIGSWFADSMRPYFRSKNLDTVDKIAIFITGLLAATLIGYCWSAKLSELLLS